MRVLVCAATKSEHEAVVVGIRAAAAAGYETLLTGVGPAHAASALRTRLSQGSRPDLVVSTGLAGALTPGLARLSWVTANHIFEWDGRDRIPIADVTFQEAPLEAVRCELVSSAELVLGSSALSLARGAEPLVVDMETAGLARQARDCGVAFMVLRLVSDTPEHPLPPFVSPFAAAMAESNVGSRIALAARGVYRAFTDPRGVVGIVRDGSEWKRLLAKGWERFATSHLMRTTID